MGKAVTHKTDSFAAEVVVEKTTGHRKLKMMAPKYLEHFINQLKVGEKVSVRVTSQRAKRTVNQNNYYWGVYLPLIAQETGEGDTDRLHALFKGKFLTTGIHTVLGEKVRTTKSTTDLSIGEFNEYIINISLLTEVQPPPTENYDMAPLKKKQ